MAVERHFEENTRAFYTDAVMFGAAHRDLYMVQILREFRRDIILSRKGNDLGETECTSFCSQLLI